MSQNGEENPRKSKHFPLLDFAGLCGIFRQFGFIWLWLGKISQTPIWPNPPAVEAPGSIWYLELQ
jgi:hypothetical protein